MSLVNIPKLTYPRLTPHRYCNNGKIVQASFQTHMMRRLNQAFRWRTKEVFRYIGQINTIIASGGAGERERWRHAFHTGTFTTKLGVWFYMAPQRAGAGDPYGQFEIDGGSALTFHYGNTPGSPPDRPAYFASSLQYISVSADTDYTATWSDFDNGRLISGCVFEVSKAPLTENGYFTGEAVLGPIYDADRQSPMTTATEAWKNNGSQVFNWCVDAAGSPRTRASGTSINIVDNSSTAISGATPGYTVDLRYKNRRSQTTVPVVFKAYGRALVAGTGNVLLKDSGGSTVATVAINSTTLGWFSTTANLPATEAKYDIHYNGAGGANNTEVAAVSCYEYDGT